MKEFLKLAKQFRFENAKLKATWLRNYKKMVIATEKAQEEYSKLGLLKRLKTTSPEDRMLRAIIMPEVYSWNIDGFFKWLLENNFDEKVNVKKKKAAR